MNLSRSLGLALALVISGPFGIAQSNCGVADPLLSLYSYSGKAFDGDEAVFASAYSFQYPDRPSLQLMRRVAGSLEYLPTERIQVDSFGTQDNIFDVALEGNLIAHQLYEASADGTKVFIHERQSNGWGSDVVQISNRRILRSGDLTAISGRRVAAVHAHSVYSRLWVNIIEEDALGAWGLTDRVLTRVRGPWVDHRVEIALEGDVVAVGGVHSEQAGWISICEPIAAGDWEETLILRPPTRALWVVEAIGIEDGRLAAVRSSRTDQGREYLLQTYQRHGLGDWRLDARRRVPTPEGSPSVDDQGILKAWALQFDGDDLIVSNRVATTIYSAPLGGSITPLRRIEGLGTLLHQDGPLLMGADRSVARVVNRSATQGDIVVDQLAGQSTCASTSAARLNLHRTFTPIRRRQIAEIVDAPVGATAVLFHAPQASATPAASTGLCLDRQTLGLVGSPTIVSSHGAATFEVPPTSAVSEYEHFQVLLVGGAQSQRLSVSNGAVWVR